MTDTKRFVQLPRASWATLPASSVDLDPATIARLRGIDDPTDETDVREVFRPLAELMARHARNTGQLGRDTADFLGFSATQPPFIVGIAGSVAVGKSTVARLVAELLRRSPGLPKVDLITTDSFLLSNADLETRGLINRKGFPESYDTAALLQFVSDVKTGCPDVATPVYSHIIYDIVPDQHTVVDRPDILVLEGLNVLQPPPWPSPSCHPALSVSDLIDFSIYVDADEANIRDWFIQRFLQLRSTAFSQPDSFFRQYACLDDATAVNLAQGVWDDINGPNLRQYIAPTMQRATVILRKGADHGVESVSIRQV